MPKSHSRKGGGILPPVNSLLVVSNLINSLRIVWYARTEDDKIHYYLANYNNPKMPRYENYTDKYHVILIIKPDNQDYIPPPSVDKDSDLHYVENCYSNSNSRNCKKFNTPDLDAKIQRVIALADSNEIHKVLKAHLKIFNDSDYWRYMNFGSWMKITHKDKCLDELKEDSSEFDGGAKRKKLLESCTVAELKAKAAKRGISLKGLTKKSDIIAKLRR